MFIQFYDKERLWGWVYFTLSFPISFPGVDRERIPVFISSKDTKVHALENIFRIAPVAPHPHSLPGCADEHTCICRNMCFHKGFGNCDTLWLAQEGMCRKIERFRKPGLLLCPRWHTGTDKEKKPWNTRFLY